MFLWDLEPFHELELRFKPEFHLPSSCLSLSSDIACKPSRLRPDNPPFPCRFVISMSNNNPSFPNNRPTGARIVNRNADGFFERYWQLTGSPKPTSSRNPVNPAYDTKDDKEMSGALNNSLVAPIPTRSPPSTRSRPGPSSSNNSSNESFRSARSSPDISRLDDRAPVDSSRFQSPGGTRVRPTARTPQPERNERTLNRSGIEGGSSSSFKKQDDLGSGTLARSREGSNSSVRIRREIGGSNPSTREHGIEGSNRSRGNIREPRSRNGSIDSTPVQTSMEEQLDNERSGSGDIFIGNPRGSNSSKAVEIAESPNTRREIAGSPNSRREISGSPREIRAAERTVSPRLRRERDNSEARSNGRGLAGSTTSPRSSNERVRVPRVRRERENDGSNNNFSVEEISRSPSNEINTTRSNRSSNEPQRATSPRLRRERANGGNDLTGSIQTDLDRSARSLTSPRFRRVQGNSDPTIESSGPPLSPTRETVSRDRSQGSLDKNPRIRAREEARRNQGRSSPPPSRTRENEEPRTVFASRFARSNSNDNTSSTTSRFARNRSNDIPPSLDDEETVADDNEATISQQEMAELEKSRLELARLKEDKKVADRREAEQIVAARERQVAIDRERRRNEGRSSGSNYSLVNKSQIHSELLVPEYLEAIVTTITNDTTLSPVPEDFPSLDDYSQWRSSMRRSLQYFVAQMIKSKYEKQSEPQKPQVELLDMRFRVIKASGLLSKDGKPRDTYCNIEYGDLNTKNKNREIFRTETIPNSLDPIWNQKMTIPAKSLTQKIQLQVFDRQRDHFLGQAIIPMSELINESVRNGSFEQWYGLEPDKKHKDKHVGGRILIGAEMLNYNKPQVCVTN